MNNTEQRNLLTGLIAEHAAQQVIKAKSNKLILIKEGQVAVTKETIACNCDFCGGSKGKMCFTSSFEDEMQICEPCVRQLTKLLPA